MPAPELPAEVLQLIFSAPDPGAPWLDEPKPLLNAQERVSP